MVTGPSFYTQPSILHEFTPPCRWLWRVGILRGGRPTSFTAQLPGCFFTYPRDPAFAIQAHTQSPARPSTGPPSVTAAGPARACQWCLGYRTAGREARGRLGPSLPCHLLLRVSLALREIPGQDQMEMRFLIRKTSHCLHACLDC